MSSFIDDILGSEVDKKAVSAFVCSLENQLASPLDGRLSGAKHTANTLPHSKRSNQVSAASNSSQSYNSSVATVFNINTATGSPTITGKSSYSSNSRSSISTPINIAPMPTVTSAVSPSGNRSTSLGLPFIVMGQVKGPLPHVPRLVSAAMSVPKTNTPQNTVHKLSPQIHSMQQTGSTQRIAIKQEPKSLKQPPASLNNNQHMRTPTPGKPVQNHVMVIKNESKIIANHLPHSAAIKSASTVTQHSNMTAVQNHATAQVNQIKEVIKEQVMKSQSLFTTLITKATNKSPEIGKAVQELIMALMNNKLTEEDFVAKLQKTYIGPLSPNVRTKVVEFLKSTLPYARMAQQQKTAAAATAANPPAVRQVQKPVQSVATVRKSQPTTLPSTQLNRQVPAVVNKFCIKSTPTSAPHAFSRLPPQQQLRTLDQNPVLQQLFPESHVANLKKKRDFSASKDPRPYPRLKGHSTSTSAAQAQGKSKARPTSSIFAVTRYANSSGILRAAEAGHFRVVKRFVESGTDVKEKGDDDNTVLHYAVRFGSLEMVKYLVEHGAEVNCINVSNKTSLHYAVICDSLEMVKYLVEHGAMVTTEHKQGHCTVLDLACYKGNHPIVDYLLQHGAIKDIDSYDDGQYSPLILACLNGRTAVVQTLLKYNVDIRKQRKLICGNDEIINILNLELKKSIKHHEKIQALKAMDGDKMTKVGPPVMYFAAQTSFALGKGSMGTCVYVGVMEDGREVAVKRMLSQASEPSAQNEIEILSRSAETESKSPYIVSYRHFLRDNDFMYIILDLCEETLQEHVRSQTDEHIREHGPRMIKEILTGLEFLHGLGILHRDLKPSNVLVDVDGHMKLSDFGISRVLDEGETKVYTDAKGTRDWIPAEVIEALNQRVKGHYKKKSDVHVVGMIGFFILTKGEHPFGSSSLECMQNILKGDPVNLNKLHDLDARQFVAWLINHNINDRPYAHEALGHRFMVGVKEYEVRPKVLKCQ